MTEPISERLSADAPPANEEAVREPRLEQTPPGSSEDGKARRKRRLVIGGLGVLVLAAVLVLGITWVRDALNTVSTDDAYVNGHVTFVAPRVRGQVARVLVDDNNRVRRGDLLVELDKEPYLTAVAI